MAGHGGVAKCADCGQAASGMEIASNGPMTRTWFAAVLLAAVAGAGTAAAEGPAPGPAVPRAVKPGKIPYRVVELMPETEQALVYDRGTSAHLLVQIGDDLGDYQVIEV